MALTTDNQKLAQAIQGALLAFIEHEIADYDFQVAEHPTYGTILDAGRIKVRVPADQAAAVKALVAEYRAEVERRIDADLAVSKEYDEGRERMRRVMGY